MGVARFLAGELGARRAPMGVARAERPGNVRLVGLEQTHDVAADQAPGERRLREGADQADQKFAKAYLSESYLLEAAVLPEGARPGAAAPVEEAHASGRSSHR